ncbi:hypothetical protein M9H77_02176 [Catharanthus roseus]|uniref:Uncharacterized protein n=1 Tax=Catharanthus roseus TaxID=4058 RepID=A0ACC0C7T0_CATRO|nr:hypothetical protein M9H77_02176 [Catharanthus roseus]
MEGNHISESRDKLILNDGSGKEGELREGSDNTEGLQEPRGRETEQVLPVSIEETEMHDTAGKRPSKSVRILEVQARGSDKLGCLPRDCRNNVQKVRRLNIGAGDTDCINRMFIRMHQKNSDFFHLIRMDEEVAYEEFNDVDFVDSMDLVNKYKIPTWHTAIGGQSSVAIMTDQCESMGDAIKEVMPTTI